MAASALSAMASLWRPRRQFAMAATWLGSAWGLRIPRIPGGAWRGVLCAVGGAAAKEPVYWDILATNPAAADLAREWGFARSRELMRMARGGSLTQDASLTFAIAGFEFG